MLNSRGLGIELAGIQLAFKNLREHHDARIANIEARLTALEAKNGSLTPKAPSGRRFDEEGKEIL